MRSLRKSASGGGPHSARSELCWFGATAFAVTGYILVLAAVDVSAGPGWSRPGFMLITLAALALALTALLMKVAFRLGRRRREGG